MEAASNHLEDGESSTLYVRTLLLHEDVPTCLRGWSILDVLARNLEQRNLMVHFSAHVWKFESLAVEAQRERALSEADGVDLVVLAARGKPDLPAPVRSWLEQWISRRGSGDCGFVVSLDSRKADSPLAYIRALAARTNVEVFAHWAEAPLGPWDWHLEPVRPDSAPAQALPEGLLLRYEAHRR